MSTSSPPRRAFVQGLSTAATTLALAIGAVVLPIGTASAAPPECTATRPGGPVQVTPDCVDPLYANPVIDSERIQGGPEVNRPAGCIACLASGPRPPV